MGRTFRAPDGSIKESESKFWAVVAFIVTALATGLVLNYTAWNYVDDANILVTAGRVLFFAATAGLFTGAVAATITYQVVWRREMTLNRRAGIDYRLEQLDESLTGLHQRVWALEHPDRSAPGTVDGDT